MRLAICPVCRGLIRNPERHDTSSKHRMFANMADAGKVNAASYRDTLHELWPDVMELKGGVWFAPGWAIVAAQAVESARESSVQDWRTMAAALDAEGENGRLALEAFAALADNGSGLEFLRQLANERKDNKCNPET